MYAMTAQSKKGVYGKDSITECTQEKLMDEGNARRSESALHIMPTPYGKIGQNTSHFSNCAK
jgi:hypothetical protein